MLCDERSSVFSPLQQQRRAMFNRPAGSRRVQTSSCNVQGTHIFVLRTSRGSAGDETRLVPVYATVYWMLVCTYLYMMSGIELTTNRKRALTHTYIERIDRYMPATRYNYPCQYIKIILLP